MSAIVSMINDCLALVGPVVSLQFAICHEMGHALGLGHDGGQKSLMNAHYSGNFQAETTLTDDEKLGLKTLYPTPYKKLAIAQPRVPNKLIISQVKSQPTSTPSTGPLKAGVYQHPGIHPGAKSVPKQSYNVPNQSFSTLPPPERNPSKNRIRLKGRRKNMKRNIKKTQKFH